MILSTPRPSDPDPLTDTLLGAADVIQLAIFAHTHEDEIKLLEKHQPRSQAPAIPVKLVPSISPINGNLPSITVADIDPASATLIDYKVIAGSQTVPWKQQYDYADDYGEASFSAAAVRDLVTKFAADSSRQRPGQPELHPQLPHRQADFPALPGVAGLRLHHDRGNINRLFKLRMQLKPLGPPHRIVWTGFRDAIFPSVLCNRARLLLRLRSFTADQDEQEGQGEHDRRQGST